MSSAMPRHIVLRIIPRLRRNVIQRIMPQLPWEVIERVMASCMFETLRNISLTCHQLRPRSLCLMVRDVDLDSRDKIFNFCDVLRGKPLSNHKSMRFCPIPPPLNPPESFQTIFRYSECALQHAFGRHPQNPFQPGQSRMLPATWNAYSDSIPIRVFSCDALGSCKTTHGIQKHPASWLQECHYRRGRPSRTSRTTPF